MTLNPMRASVRLPSSPELPLTIIKIPWPNAASGPLYHFGVLLSFKNVLSNADEVSVKVYVPAEERTMYRSRLRFCEKLGNWTDATVDKMKFACDCYSPVCPTLGIMVLNHKAGLNVQMSDWEIF